MKKRYIIINLIDDQISSFINFLQHTMIINILQRRCNTWCKAGKSHTAVSHWTNRSLTRDNASKGCPVLLLLYQIIANRLSFKTESDLSISEIFTQKGIYKYMRDI